MQELSERVAVITGGAGGIGRAMAERFAAEGTKLVLADIEEAVLDETVDQLRSKGASVVGVPTDVAAVAQVESLAARALSEFGGVHIVANNAGVGGGPVIGTPLAVWEWVFGVNVWGVVNGCNTFLPILLEQNEGHIINTASLAGLGGVPGLGTYCASKFAVVGLSESLHHELSMLGSAVRVSVLCPGFVRTRIHESDRNMPADVAAVADTPGALLMADLAKAAVEAGISVDVVAEAVYSAVVEERFYVLTHQQAATGTTEARIAWMVDGQPPVMDLEAVTKPL